MLPISVRAHHFKSVWLLLSLLVVDALGSRAGASFVKQSRLACTCFYAFVTGPVRTSMILRSMLDGKRSAEGALEPPVEILRQPGWQHRH